jgi:sec-independent protein translocase protein TatC
LSFLLSIPFTVLQIWKFVEPALKKKEKKSILPTLIWSPILFALGTSLCYFLIMPIIMEFFTAYNSSINLPNADISLLQNVKEYFSFFMTLLIAFGLAFQLPIVLIFLIRLGILSVNNLKKFRRYFIVLAFITGAILTPPDVLSQILLSIPLIILYESTILIAKQK